MRLARELSKHSALLCMRNKAKADIIAKILDEMGIERAFTDNTADAFREMKQRLPHMIIMDSQLRDGNAGIVHDRLAKEEPFRRIPLVVCVEQRSKEALLPLVGKMFEAIFIGDIQPKAFRAKLDEILSTRLIASPFGFDPIRAGISNIISSRFNMELMMASPSHIIMRTQFGIDHRADYYVDGTLKGEFVRATLKNGSPFFLGNQSFGSFPTADITGANDTFLKLISQTLTYQGFASLSGNRPVKRVIVYHPVADIFEKLRPALTAAGLSPEHVSSYEELLSTCVPNGNPPFVIYLHEALDATHSGHLVRILGKDFSAGMVRLIVATRNPAATDIGNLRYVHPPLTVGSVSSAIIGSAIDVDPLRDVLDPEKKRTGCHDGFLNARIDVRMCVLDENGVIIESPRPLTRGFAMSFKHEVLGKFFPGRAPMRIDRGFQVKNTSPTFQYRCDYKAQLESPMARWRLLKDSVPRIPSKSECVFFDTADTRLSPKAQQLAGILRQAINEVIEYYTGDLAPNYEIGIGAQRIPLSGMMAVRIPISGPGVAGQFMLVCRPEFMVKLSTRVTGTPRSVAQQDPEVHKQVAIEMADQIFGKSQFIAAATGADEFEIKNATAEVPLMFTKEEKAWADVVVIPCASKDEKFFVAAYVTHVKQAGVADIKASS